MRRYAVAAVVCSLALFGGASLALADNQASSNFSVFSNTFAPAVFDQSSSNFSINASVEPIVGISSSPSFNLRIGAPVKDTINPVTPPPVTPPVVTPGPSGGGGGGGFTSNKAATTTQAATTTPVATTTAPTVTGKAKAPTLLYRAQTFLSHQVISGVLGASDDVLTVNGSQTGVKYLPNQGWQFDLPLFVGYNDIRIQAKDKSGRLSDIIGGTTERMLVGDASRYLDKGREHIVNDVDISIFTRSWKKYNFYSDFNEDGKIDDIDLSLMVSHWNVTANY